MPAFTKGKWKVNAHAPEGFCHPDKVNIISADGEYIASVQNDADARLIVAAPELYWLVKSVVDGSAFEVDIHGHYIFTTKKAEEFRKILNRIDGKEAES